MYVDERATLQRGLGIRIRKPYNLGNHIRQVMNSVRLAELIGASYVCLPSKSPFVAGNVGQVQLRISEEYRKKRLRKELVGTFFYNESVGVQNPNLDSARILRDLRSLFSPVPEQPLLASDCLVIHLRAGDVFDANPHPLYGPPPLRFYFESIEKSKATSIHIVTQSLGHPYIPLLETWCLERGTPITVSSSDLSSDFNLMRGSQMLCISQGTLALAAAWLSTSCSIVFCFDRTNQDLVALRDLGVEINCARGFDYPVTWTASAHEIALLTSLNRGRIVWEAQ